MRRASTQPRAMWVAFRARVKMLESAPSEVATRRLDLSAAPPSVVPPAVTPSDLAWRVIGLLNLYRLLVPLTLLAMQTFAGPAWGLTTARPLLFVAACIAYFTAAVLLVIARRLHWRSSWCCRCWR
jgi:two-component system, NtrC family, sensor histidine kinase PilS